MVKDFWRVVGGCGGGEVAVHLAVIYISLAFNEPVHAKRALCLLYKNQDTHTQESKFGDLNI